MPGLNDDLICELEGLLARGAHDAGKRPGESVLGYAARIVDRRHRRILFQARSELMDRMFEVDGKEIVSFAQIMETWIMKTLRPTDEERSQIEALGRRESLTLRGVKLTRLDTRRYLIDGQGAELWHDEMMLQLKLSPGDERDMELDALGVGDGFIVSVPDKTISVTRVV